MTGYFLSTGEAVTFKKTSILSAVTGYFKITGEDGTLVKQSVRNIAADPGQFLITGEAITAAATRKLTAATGYFISTGEAATTVKAKKLIAATGAFILTGEAATLKVTRALSAATGAFKLTGGKQHDGAGKETARHCRVLCSHWRTRNVHAPSRIGRGNRLLQFPWRSRHTQQFKTVNYYGFQSDARCGVSVYNTNIASSQNRVLQVDTGYFRFPNSVA